MDENTNNQFSMPTPERLKIIRRDMGVSQKEMARILDITTRAWQTYEEGKSSPGSMIIRRLVGLRYNANWILLGVGEMKIEEKAAPEMPAAPRAEDPRLTALMEKLECIYKEGGFDEKARLRGTIEELYDEVCIEERKELKGAKAA